MPNLFRVHLLVDADENATIEDVKEYMYNLQWIGGCRDPDNDPMFNSVEVLENKVTKGRVSRSREYVEK